MRCAPWREAAGRQETARSLSGHVPRRGSASGVEPGPFAEGAGLGGGARRWEAAVASGHVRGGPCPGRGRGLGEEAGLMPRRLQLLGVRLPTRRASAVAAAPGCCGLRVELPCSRTVVG